MLTSLRSILAVALFLVAGADPLFNLMPSDGIPPGWQRSGSQQLFVGAELYRHINGAAELYHQYGFDRLAVQDFAKADHELRVEIFKMNDPAGAAAVFAEMTAGMEIQATYGSACVLDDYQVLFRRGAYLVSLTTYEKGAEPSAAMAALAAKIDSALLATDH